MVNAQVKENRTRLDVVQLLAVAGLLLVGVVFVYSATMVNEPIGFWQEYREQTFVQFLGWLMHQLFFRQIVWYALGATAAVALAIIHYQTLTRWAMVAYTATIILLVAVLIPFIGSLRYGARRWIDLGFFQFQPSEFAKLAFILAMAHFLSRPQDELRQPRVFWKAIGLMALPFLLIMKEPDLGSALVLVPTGLVLMFVAGTPRRYLIQLCGGVGLLAVLFLMDVLFA